MKTLLVTLASAALTCCIIANAFYQKKQFYPSVIFITRSNSSMSVIYLQAFICVLLIGKLFRFIFFGELRPTETENLIERSWHAISETCLAFTVFRDDLNPKFVALFTLLLFLKCFHWLAEDRVDFMERSPNISLLFHIRIASLLTILGLLDIMFISFAYHSTMLKGASVQLVFGFEYAILLAVIITIIIKYSLHRYDLEQRDVPWENKGVYLLYFELLVSLYKVVLYLSFIVVMARIHSFPLFAIRSMYLSVKAFQKALNDVILSRRAIRNMNTLYPNATPEELASVDNVCIICREEMIGNGTAKKLPCNHIFHVSCLRSWFQRQQTCPTCRMNILQQQSNQNSINQQQQQQANLANNNNQQQQQQQQQNQQQQPNSGGGAAAANQQRANAVNQVNNDRQQPADNQQRNNNNNGTTNNSTATTTTTTNQQSSDRNRTTNTTNSTSTGTTTRITSAALFPPFMGFSFMPFMPFPPLNAAGSNQSTTASQDQQTNLSQLTEDELRRLEGDERAALEARIRLLQNLRTSIDAIVLQFQQYNQLIVRSQQVHQQQQQQQQQQQSNDQQTSQSTTTDQTSTNQSSSSSSTTTSKNDNKEAENIKASTSKVKTEQPLINDDVEKSTDQKNQANAVDQLLKVSAADSVDTPTTFDQIKDDIKTNTEEDLVRQLRLRKFNNQTLLTDQIDNNGQTSSSVKNEDNSTKNDD